MIKNHCLYKPMYSILGGLLPGVTPVKLYPGPDAPPTSFSLPFMPCLDLSEETFFTLTPGSLPSTFVETGFIAGEKAFLDIPITEFTPCRSPAPPLIILRRSFAHVATLDPDLCTLNCDLCYGECESAEEGSAPGVEAESKCELFKKTCQRK